jgi:hypothetical protein
MAGDFTFLNNFVIVDVLQCLSLLALGSSGTFTLNAKNSITTEL